jgi:hypothetical protein
MGARHPQDLIKRTGISKFDLVSACRFLVRTGVVQKPADAIRYIEENEVDLDTIMDQYIESMRTPAPLATDLEDVPDELM